MMQRSASDDAKPCARGGRMIAGRRCACQDRHKAVCAGELSSSRCCALHPPPVQQAVAIERGRGNPGAANRP
ncbi:MAG: hypothetical protein WBJ06_00820 [Candidatus Methanoculleus thermohydrogenotrophicum]|nr:hypothetical protein [Candidatus Methanoculleus thermohydrogenotrophicum]